VDDDRIPKARPARRPLDLPQVSGATDDEVLRGYLELVRTWRDRSTSTVRFRHDDLVVLVGILGTDAREIERRLVSLTGCTRSTARRFRRLLLISAAALPVGLTGLAIAVPSTPVVQEPPSIRSAATTAPVLTAVDPITTQKSAIVREPVASTPVPPAPATVLEPTSTPLVPTAEPLPGAEATVSIPDLGIDLPVVEGGQSVIDEGIVAHYTATGWLEPTPAGAVGTYWLAAHHATHGGPFADLPDIAVGDAVTITTPTESFTYTVTSLEVVRPDAGFGPVYGADPSARAILLQTCLDSTRRLLVHGILTVT
jgi:LPXTG-site transpeptidase (sortase) family protein